MVGDWCIVESAYDSVVNKVSWWLDPNGGYILSMKTCLCLNFYFGVVDG